MKEINWQVPKKKFNLDWKRGEEHWNPFYEKKEDLPLGNITPIEGCGSITKCMEYMYKRNTNKVFIKSRKQVAKHKRKLKDKTIYLPEFAEETEDMTYGQAEKIVKNISNNLKNRCKVVAGQNVGVYENTRKEWFLSALGIWKTDAILTTAYSAFSIFDLIDIIKRTNLTTMFLSSSNLAKIMKHESEYPELKNLVYFYEFGDEEKELPKSNLRWNLIPFSEFSTKSEPVKEEEETKEEEKKEKTEDEVFDSHIITMFTSGSTGRPKGVVLKNRNVLAGVVNGILVGKFNSNDVYAAYLPLAHIFELVAEVMIAVCGGMICYSTSKTLTDKGALPCGDLAAYKPTLLFGVPRVYETIKKGVLNLISQKSKLVRSLFHTSYRKKLKDLKAGKLQTGGLFGLVFKTIRKKMGNKIRLIGIGGSAISQTTMDFLKICFGCDVLNGFGLTETCCTGTNDHVADYQGTASYICPAVTMKLRPVPEMGYTTDGEIEQGEICLKGPCVFEGYLDEALNKDVFTEDGFFRTGDIGSFQNNKLQIIDRLKNLSKHENGEYVALEKCESIFDTSKFVAPNGLVIFPDKPNGFKHLCAVVIPNLEFKKNWIKENEDVWDENLYIDQILKDFKVLAKRNDFKSFEMVSKIIIDQETEWTPENKLLTSSYKKKRVNLKKFYQSKIDAALKSLSN